MAIKSAEASRNSLRPLLTNAAWQSIVAACAKLDHTANRIRLRCRAGFRTASSRNTPNVAYTLIIIVSP